LGAAEDAKKRVNYNACVSTRILFMEIRDGKEGVTDVDEPGFKTTSLPFTVPGTPTLYLLPVVSLAVEPT
jgi:hypothetical protein